MSIYFDNSATTQVTKEAAQKALSCMCEIYGNPSSLHSLGFAAQRELSTARGQVAAALGALPEEITFTSGGTESNHLAILGGAQAKRRFGLHVLTTAIEHPSVLGAMAELEGLGFSVTYLQPDHRGEISAAAVAAGVQEDTVLVSLMSVNNETGVRLPLHAVRPAISRRGARALFHVDHVQGFGKEVLPLKRLGIDLASVSAHKIHGPKGVGALYLKKGQRILPERYGGGQEKKLRPGTENLPGIAAMGVAASLLPKEDVAALTTRLRHRLGEIPGVVINSPESASPYILNFAAPPVRGETLLHFLAAREIYVSTGSACAGGAESHVLSAMGLPRERVQSSLRVSFCAQNTIEEVEQFVRVLTEGLASLCHA